jgi:hypothetical protein
VPGGGVQVQAAAGLLPVPHLPPHLPHRHHVLDLLLDQARGRTCQGHPGCHLPTHPLHPARQQPEVPPTGLIYKGNIFLHPACQQPQVSPSSHSLSTLTAISPSHQSNICIKVIFLNHVRQQPEVPPTGVIYIKVIFLDQSHQQPEVPSTGLIYKDNIPRPSTPTARSPSHRSHT